jgi:hypothetical protein
VLLELKGSGYRFEHEKRVDCGSWRHIVTALNAAVDVLARLLTSERVVRVPAIEDEFVRQLSVAGE